jgi:hypothetical protein
MDLVEKFKRGIGDLSIFQFFKDQDRFLYHYTSAKTAIDYILKDKQFKLGRYINTNDPKETKTWQFSVGTNEKRDLSGYNLTDISERLTQAMKHKTNLACFSQDENLTGDNTKDIYARGFGKSRMWAQYADNHKGICLVLEKSAIRKAATDQFGDNRFRLYGGPVIYRDRLITEINNAVNGFVINADYLEKVGIDNYVKAHVQTYHKALFFEKVTDWSRENEFRIVVFGEREEDLFLNIDGAIVGVVFGTDCTKENIMKTLAMCNTTKTQFEQIVWKNSTPWYSFRLEWVPKR